MEVSQNFVAFSEYVNFKKLANFLMLEAKLIFQFMIHASRLKVYFECSQPAYLLVRRVSKYGRKQSEAAYIAQDYG